MSDAKVCVECGREGSRGFEQTAEGWLRCSARGACSGRVQQRLQNESVYRWDYNNGNSHGYKLDGVRVPGVTTLIKDGMPAPALVGWGIRTVSRYAAAHLEEIWAMRGMGEEAVFEALRQSPYKERNDAGVRGTKLHVYAERLMRGESVEQAKIPREVLPLVEVVVQYLDEWQPKPILQEAAVASRRWGYAGTLDDVSEFPDGKRRVVDYKTGKGVYAEVALQLAAYRNAEIYRSGLGEERPMAELGVCEEGYAVHIRPEGYRVFPVQVGPEVHQAFLRVAWLGKLRTGGVLDSWLGQPLQQPE